MVVVRVTPAAEALSSFAQVIGVTLGVIPIGTEKSLPMPAGRSLGSTQRVSHRSKAGLHWLGAAEWAAGAADGWSRVSGLRVCNAGSLWVVGGGWGT